MTLQWFDKLMLKTLSFNKLALYNPECQFGCGDYGDSAGYFKWLDDYFSLPGLTDVLDQLAINRLLVAPPRQNDIARPVEALI